MNDVRPVPLPESSRRAVVSARLEMSSVAVRIIAALRHLPNPAQEIDLRRWSSGLTRELVSLLSFFHLPSSFTDIKLS